MLEKFRLFWKMNAAMPDDTACQRHSEEVERLRADLADAATQDGLGYAQLYFQQCAQHFRETADLARTKLPDRSSFVYAMQ